MPNLYLLENGKTYDASIFIDKNGEVKGVQKMVHVAQAEQFYEQDYYTPSDEGFRIFDTEYGKLALSYASTDITRRAYAQKPCRERI